VAMLIELLEINTGIDAPTIESLPTSFKKRTAHSMRRSIREEKTLQEGM
jgi:hypothetical protein